MSFLFSVQMFCFWWEMTLGTAEEMNCLLQLLSRSSVLRSHESDSPAKRGVLLRGVFMPIALRAMIPDIPPGVFAKLSRRRTGVPFAEGVEGKKRGSAKGTSDIVVPSCISTSSRSEVGMSCGGEDILLWYGEKRKTRRVSF